MINKMKKWIKSAAGVVSIILFGLATNLLGIIVTVSFVQHFIDKQSAKSEYREENLKIKRYDRFMSVLLTRYLMYFNCVTTPMERRSKNDPLRLSSLHDFTTL